LTTLRPPQPDKPCVLITGGAGSFGQAFTRHLLALPSPPRIRIYSRDEHKQEQMARAFDDMRLTFILGDVRDVSQLTIAADGCDAIVHAAALKRVPAGEQNIIEFIRTNIGGSENVVQAAIAGRVPRTLLVSSDKAVAAVNAYGKTKAAAEEIFVQANRRGVSRRCRFAVIRGGNVWGSRGSVIEVWREAMQQHEPIQVNDPGVTRFHLAMPAWCEFAWQALREMRGGEIFVPKLRAWRLGDLVEALAYDTVHHNGARAGDKNSEWLIAPHETRRAVDAGWCYVVEPSQELRAVWNYQPWPGEKVPDGFGYRSDCVGRMTMDELREIIGYGDRS